MELEMKTNSMKSLVWAGAITAAIFPACNYTVGECYPREQGDGSGDTGVVIVSSGAGGFGDAPPKQPQDVTNPPPDCNIVPGSPCNEKCQASYNENAAVCGNIENEGQRRTCQDNAYATYKSCRGNCDMQEAGCLEQCNALCDQIHDKCHARCTKDEPTTNCRAKCNNEYGTCLKACDQKCKG
jgi:hypothetical protein